MDDLTRQILAAQPATPLRLTPCTITTTSPLEATFGGDPIPCVGLHGMTYIVGPALAFIGSGISPLLIRTV